MKKEKIFGEHFQLLIFIKWKECVMTALSGCIKENKKLRL